MIAYTSTATSNNRHYPCPNCGAVHYCPETAYTFTVYIPPPTQAEIRSREWVKWKMQYDVEKESRRLALGRLPERFPPTQVRQPNVQHMVHRQRCPARRPCMTLLQRVLQGKR